jgi:hypothetical protein
MTSAYYPPEPPPRSRRSPAVWIIVAVVAGSVVLFALLAAVVATVVLKANERGGPVGDPVPFRLQPVLEVSPPPCASGMLADAEGTACYRLAEGMTVRRVREAQAGLSGEDWVVRVRLDGADTAAFNRLTTELHLQPNPRNQLAIVVEGKVLSAPVIEEPITGDQLQISGGFTKDSATKLARRLQGRPGS